MLSSTYCRYMQGKSAKKMSDCERLASGQSRETIRLTALAKAAG